MGLERDLRNNLILPPHLLHESTEAEGLRDSPKTWQTFGASVSLLPKPLGHRLLRGQTLQ